MIRGNSGPPNRSRREFVVGALRKGALGILAASGAFAVAKRRRLVREGVCINDGLCLGCAAYRGCDLPAALYARQSSERNDHAATK